jgi:uncharacterized membrane protein
MGIDVARALAVLGMMCVHLGTPADLVWLDSTTWSGIVSGRSAVLFCVLAGVSVSLVTSAHPPVTDIEVLEDRLRLVGRGLAVFSIGIALELLNTGIVVILPLYGFLFVAVIPFRRWPPRRLFMAAVGLAIVGPLAVELLKVLAIAPTGPGLALTIFNFYPLTAWLALMLAGMGMGRLFLGSTAVAASLWSGSASRWPSLVSDVGRWWTRTLRIRSPASRPLKAVAARHLSRSLAPWIRRLQVTGTGSKTGG